MEMSGVPMLMDQRRRVVPAKSHEALRSPAVEQKIGGPAVFGEERLLRDRSSQASGAVIAGG